MIVIYGLTLDKRRSFIRTKVYELRISRMEISWYGGDI